MSARFVHLHVHSEYSLADGSIRIKELVARAKSFGQTHVALTDHGNMHGAIDLYSAAKDAGLIPILGCEIYHDGSVATNAALPENLQNVPKLPAFQLVLLAQDNQGYQSLLKVVSDGYFGTQLKDVPRASENALDTYNTHLIAIASCLRSELSYLIHLLRAATSEGQGLLAIDEGQTAKSIALSRLKAHIAAMQQRYGEGGFYIELTRNHIPGQEPHVQDCITVADALQVPLVASANAHYLNQDGADTHFLAIAIKNSLNQNHIRERLRTTQFHLTSTEEMEQLFADRPDALANTLVIAERCSGLSIKTGTYYLPRIEGDQAPKEMVTSAAVTGLEERIRLLQPIYGEAFTAVEHEQYRQRLAYELKVITEMGFADYFLIVADFIGWAKEHDIPVGPGRGSGAGSLVAYSLKITDIDPIPYGLIFERFLNPERISMPDFDVDFCQWRRDEVIAYCVKKYGAANVAQITTFGKMQAKAAVKSVGRAMNLGYGRVDRFTKLFPKDLGITIGKALEQEPRLKEEMEKDDQLTECMTYALKLEGLTSHTSVHAAGIVISDGAMTNYVPIYTTDGKTLITQYEMKPTEKVGLVKFDFLGLKTLTVIQKAVRLVRERRDKDFDIDRIRRDDKAVFTMLSGGHTCGIFQCEGGGITNLIKKLLPSSFEDVIALVALFRPGPLGSGMVDDFVERKHGRQAIRYPHPALEPILKETYGMIVYQEQVQKIAAVLANYTLGEADLLRKAMGKKIAEEMAKQKQRFIAGCQQNELDPVLAEEIFDLMAEFAKYGFNKSHSAAYGLITYQTAYLKTYYPEEFLAASMTCDMDNTDKVVRYVEDCRRLGLTLLPPDINRSNLEFDVPADKTVGFALAAIKGVGSAVMDLLLAERKRKGRFDSLGDVAKRVNLGKLGKKTMLLLCEAGALDGFGFARQDLLQAIPEWVQFSTDLHEALSRGQRSLFDQPAAPATQALWAPRFAPVGERGRIWGIEDLYAEQKITGVFLSGHPLDFFTEDARLFNAISGTPKVTPRGTRTPFQMVALLGGISQKRAKNGNLIAYIRLNQKTQATEAIMFSKALAEATLPPDNSLVLAFGNLEQAPGATETRMSIERLVPLETIRRERVRGIVIALSSDTAQEYIPALQKLAETHPGDASLHFSLRFQGATVQVATDQKLDLSDRFFIELIKLPIKDIGVEFRL